MALTFWGKLFSHPQVKEALIQRMSLPGTRLATLPHGRVSCVHEITSDRVLRDQEGSLGAVEAAREDIPARGVGGRPPGRASSFYKMSRSWAGGDGGRGGMGLGVL